MSYGIRAPQNNKPVEQVVQEVDSIPDCLPVHPTSVGGINRVGIGLKKPVILTGSQLPLTIFGDDAHFNLEHATQAAVLAAEKKIAEVMIVFNDRLLRGCRTVKVSESEFRAFQSPAFEPLGSITSVGVNFNHLARTASQANDELEVAPHFEMGVMTVDLVPGQLPDLIDPVLGSGRCRGLILKSHGAGSVPNVGAFSFIDLIKRSVEEYRVPVIVSTKFLGGNSFKEVNDEPAVQAIEAGAIPSGDMTDVMTEVKLMWLLAQGHRTSDALRQLMARDFIGEVTPF